MRIFLNMRLKIFLMALIINLLVIIVISSLFYQQSAEFFDTQYAKSASDRLYIGMKNVDKGFQDIYRNTIEASFNEQIKKLVINGSEVSLNELSKILRDYKDQEHLMDTMYCYIPKTHQLIKSEQYNSVQIIDEQMATKWINLIEQQQGMQPLYTSDIFSSSAKSVYIYKSTIKDEQNNILAYIVCTINERAMYYTYLDDIARNGDNAIYMFDDNGNIVSANKNIEASIAKEIFNTAIKYKVGKLDIDIESNRYLGVYTIAPFSKYVFCLAVNKNAYMGNLLLVQLFIIFCAFIILIVSGVIIYFMAKRLNRPIEELAIAMQKVSKGDLSIRAKVQSNDEIGKLSRIFNHMISRISRLVDDLATEKSLKKEAELNALQYQIRPHFIYNTLNSIRFAALMQGAKNIGNLLASFIDLLQVSTNRKGSFAKLSDELSTLKNYIAVQEFRLMDTFKVDFAINEDTLNLVVPRLILQPLVENSIIHGPSERKAFCNIIIKAYIKDNYLYLEVEDDGQGMNEEQMRHFTDKVKKTSGGFSGIGVFNIKERLNLYYGEKSSLKYFSDGKTYTRAQLKLPISQNLDEFKL